MSRPVTKVSKVVVARVVDLVSPGRLFSGPESLLGCDRDCSCLEKETRLLNQMPGLHANRIGVAETGDTIIGTGFPVSLKTIII